MLSSASLSQLRRHYALISAGDGTAARKGSAAAATCRRDTLCGDAQSPEDSIEIPRGSDRGGRRNLQLASLHMADSGRHFAMAAGTGFQSLGDGDARAILIALMSTDPMAA